MRLAARLSFDRCPASDDELIGAVRRRECRRETPDQEQRIETQEDGQEDPYTLFDRSFFPALTRRSISGRGRLLRGLEL
jgi:hypothetical protein